MWNPFRKKSEVIASQIAPNLSNNSAVFQAEIQDIAPTINTGVSNTMSISLGSIGHVFATAAHDLKVGAQAFAKFFEAHGSQIGTDIQVVGGVLSTIPGLGPTGAVVERAGEATLGVILDAINKIEGDLKPDASGNVSVPVQVSKDLIAELKLLLPAIKGQAATTTSAPAPTPSPVVSIPAQGIPASVVAK
jgi:hypothetical protein